MSGQPDAWQVLADALQQRRPRLTIVRGTELADGAVRRLWESRGASHVLLGDGPNARALVARVRAELPNVEVHGA